MQRGRDTFLAAHLDGGVDEVKVGQLAVEPLQLDVHAADAVDAELEVDGRLQRATPPRQLTALNVCTPTYTSTL